MATVVANITRAEVHYIFVNSGGLNRCRFVNFSII